MSRAIATLLAAMMLAACGRSGQDTAPVADAGLSLREEPCWFDNVGANPATCAWLRPVRQDSTGRTQLPVVVLRQRAQQPSEHVVIFLNGGPAGESGFDDEGMRMWRMRRAQLGLHHDLVLYDQRGSGLARPEVACSELDAQMRDEHAHQRTFAERSDRFFEALETCSMAVPLADRSAGLYSTETAVADLNDLIAALQRQYGYQNVSLLGSSYGTRLAIVAAQQPDFPVTSMVLDSMHPPGATRFFPYPHEFEAQLGTFEAYCAEGYCELPRTGLRPLLRAAMDRLKQAPILTEVRDPQRPGERIATRVDAEDLVSVVLLSLYIDSWAEQMPDMLEKLAAGEEDDRWQSLFELLTYITFDMGVNFVSNQLIRCRDEAPPDKKEMTAQLEHWTMFREIVRPPSRLVGVCNRLAIPNAPLSDDWQVRIPTLVLSIVGDINTPLEHALEAMEHFTDAEHIIVPGSGHGVIDIDSDSAWKAGRFLNGERRLDELFDDENVDFRDIPMCTPQDEPPYSA